MNAGIAEIRLPRWIGSDVGAYAFKLSAPDILQILPLRRSGGRLIEINRNLMTLPDLLAYVASHGDAIFDGNAFNGDERHHVGRPHAGMRALVNIQINQLGRLAHSSNGCLL